MRVAFSVVSACAFAVGLSVVACGSSNADNGDAGPPAEFVEGGSVVPVDGQAIIEKDPFPQWCGAENRSAPPLPGGTVDCPDDKNLQGCPCTTVGATAPCWPGKRANRNLGTCKDGVAKCNSQGEIGKVWGACEGAVLPKAGSVQEACSCFSGGEWKIQNLVPCFVQSGANYYATSAACPPNPSDPAPPPSVPAGAWSPNTLKVDCEGRFKLCYTIKAGDPKNPQPSDCSLSTVCTEGDYVEKNKAQAFPDLPGWYSNNSDCVKKILVDKSPIYGEMTVIGQSVFCDKIEKNGASFVFHRLPYCALDDKTCQNSGAGQF